MLDAQIAADGWKGGDGDASYLNQTLTHQLIELSLDESVSGQVIRRFWGRAAGVASIWFVFFALIALLSAGPSTLGASGGSGGGGMFAVATLGSFFIFWIVFLFSRIQEPIGEWRVLLADRAAAKPAVYSQIYGRLRDRNMPISFTARRIRTGLGRDSVGDRVVLEDGHYFAYISVFEYGTSLYLGWMMWRNRRGSALVARFLSDLVAGLLGQLDPVRLMLRTERPRAMREAVHAVCREGLHVAIENLSVPDSYGFPSGLPPIEDGDLAAGVAPRSVPSAPTPAPAHGKPHESYAPAEAPLEPQYQYADQYQQQPQIPTQPQYQEAQPQYQEAQPLYQDPLSQSQYQEPYQEPYRDSPQPAPTPLPASGFFQRPDPYQTDPSGGFGQLNYPDPQQNFQQQQPPQQQWSQDEQGWREQ